MLVLKLIINVKPIKFILEVLKMNKITYRRVGDYLVPDLYLPKQPSKSIDKYGRLRLNYLKEHKRGLYTKLLISGTQKQHLIEIDESYQ